MFNALTINQIGQSLLRIHHHNQEQKTKKDCSLLRILQRFFSLNHREIWGCGYYQGEMELFNTYDIKKLYESANNSFRKNQLSLCQEPQLIWSFQNYMVCALPRYRMVRVYSKLESEPPQHNLRHRLSTWWFSKTLRN